jgi:hypothetical protein
MSPNAEDCPGVSTLEFRQFCDQTIACSFNGLFNSLFLAEWSCIKSNDAKGGACQAEGKRTLWIWTDDVKPLGSGMVAPGTILGLVGKEEVCSRPQTTLHLFLFRQWDVWNFGNGDGVCFLFYVLIISILTIIRNLE